MNPVINTQNLRKRFGRTVAVDDLNLAVREGAIYAMVGANGAGKTTLIKLLMNIFSPTAGRAEVLGIDCRRLAGKAFNRIGYVSENQEMPDWMTAGSMLEYYRAFYPTWDHALEQQLVRQFDLPLKRKLKHLSRGMKMKAAFASSLAYRPSLIVLDEPFTGLDPLVRDELIEGLIERAPETTILLSRTIWPRLKASPATWAIWSKAACSFQKKCRRFRTVFARLRSRWTAHRRCRRIFRPRGCNRRPPTACFASCTATSKKTAHRANW